MSGDNPGVPWKRIIEADEMDGPHCWIQWKGTDVCMDFHCSCGHHGHVDAEFAYFVRCSACKKLWASGQNIRLHELSEDETKAVEAMNACTVESS